MMCPSKLVAYTLILAMIVSSMVMINSTKVNAADGGSESATGKITIWCYYMPGRDVAVFNETGYPVDDFYVWNTVIGPDGPMNVDYSVLTAINDGNYYSVDKLYTIKVKEAYTKPVYTTYAHGGDVISIAYTADGYTAYPGNKPPKNPVSTPSPTNVPSSTPTSINPTPSSPIYSNPPTGSAPTGSSTNDSAGFLEGFGWEKALLTITTVVIIVLALGMIVLWRRTSRLIKNNQPA